MTSHEDLGAARRIVLIGLLVLLGSIGALLIHGAVSPSPAAAEKCETCEEEPPIEEVVLETLTVKVEGAGSVSDGTEILCSSGAFSSNSCEAEYEFGEKVTLSAMPMPGMTFLGWEGSGCSGTGTCSVTMTSAKSVTAKFADITPPPSPSISSPTSEQLFEWESGTVEVKFTGIEAVAFYCGLDSNSFAATVGCSSPWSIKDPTEGTHTVYVWAKDSAGNISAPASRSFKVVITSPAEEEGGGGGEEPPKEEGGGTPGSGGTPMTTQPPSTGTQTTSSTSRIDVKLVARTRSVGRATVFRKLMLKRVPQGPFALASCKGGGCPFRGKKIHVNSGVADLSALFAGRELGPGTVIQLLAGGPEGTTETITLRIRAGKTPRVTKSWHPSPVT